MSENAQTGFREPVGIWLSAGSHQGPDDGICLMELVSLLAGEEFCANPTCADPHASAVARALNDLADDSDRQALIVYAARLSVSVDPGLARQRARCCARCARRLADLVGPWNPEAAAEAADRARACELASQAAAGQEMGAGHLLAELALAGVHGGWLSAADACRHLRGALEEMLAARSTICPAGTRSPTRRRGREVHPPRGGRGQNSHPQKKAIGR